jgi:hypothetical protein
MLALLIDVQETGVSPMGQTKRSYGIDSVPGKEAWEKLDVVRDSSCEVFG